MFYAIYMATRPRACACILHKTLGLMLYLLHIIIIIITYDTLARVDEREGLPISVAKTVKSY